MFFVTSVDEFVCKKTEMGETGVTPPAGHQNMQGIRKEDNDHFKRDDDISNVCTRGFGWPDAHFIHRLINNKVNASTNMNHLMDN